MAKYKQFKYNEENYGNAALVNRAKYSVSFNVVSNWYETITISWGQLTQDPLEPPVTHWRLVRSTTGVVDHPDLGEKISYGEYVGTSWIEDFSGQDITQYVDNYESQIPRGYTSLSQLVGNTQLSYSLWVFNGEWMLVGQGDAILVFDYMFTLQNLMRGLPSSWTSDDYEGYTPGEPETSFLSKYLSSFTFYYDKLKAYSSLLAAYSDSTYTPTELLGPSISDLGFEVEPVLGDTYHRSLFKVGNLINSLKGTETGIKTFASAVTHWGTRVVAGNNLMLNYNDSSFEDGVGNWICTGGTLSYELYANTTDSSNDFGQPITPNTANLPFQETGVITVRDKGFGVITTDDYPNPPYGGYVRINCGEEDPITQGIPVSPGKYSFYVYARHGLNKTSGFGVLQLGVKFYDVRGNLISSVSAEQSFTLTNDWEKYEYVCPAVYGFSKPAFVSLHIAVSGDALDPVLLDFMSFGEYSSQDQFQDSRTALVSLYGERENLLPNPNFKYSAGGWDVRYSLDGSQVTQLEEPPVGIITHSGGFCGKITAEDENLVISSKWISVLPDKSIAFSGYVDTDAVDKTAKIRVEYSTPIAKESQASIKNGTFVSREVIDSYYNTTPEAALPTTGSVGDAYFVNGYLYVWYSDSWVNEGRYYIDSELFNLNDVNRISLVVPTPSKSMYGVLPSVKVSILFPDSVNGDEYILDSLLLEHSGYVREYFDGDGGIEPVDPNLELVISSTDCRWETGFTFNYILDPTFENGVGDWTGLSLETTTVKFGTQCGKLSGTTATSTLYLPYDGYESGADVTPYDLEPGSVLTFSAYVYGAGSYNIFFTGINVQSIGSGIYEVPANQWTRISFSGILSEDVIEGGSALLLAIGGPTNAIIDGLQLERGEYPTALVSAGATGAVLTESSSPSGTVYTWKRYGSLEAGRSYYWTRFSNKTSRLTRSLEKVMPLGSSWGLIHGDTSYRRTEYSTPSLTMYSFEDSLIHWHTGVDTIYYRVIRDGTTGYTYNPSIEGNSYLQAVGSGTSLSVYSDPIEVLPNAQYHCCVAVRGAVGQEVSLSVELLDSGVDLAAGTTDATITIADSDLWYYLTIKQPSGEELFGTGEKYFAVIHVTSSVPSGTCLLNIDRVILRRL